MNGFSITNISPGSIKFSDGTSISSTNLASITASMTNLSIVAGSSSNWLIYDSTLRTLVGCVTNQGGTGSGSFDTNTSFIMADLTTGNFDKVTIRTELLMTNSESAGELVPVVPTVDAASDGKTYGRKDGNWVDVTSAGTYPIFKLDLGLVDGSWTEFELKGSTDNFAHVVYYYQSWTNYTATTTDTNAYTYFTDDCSADTRIWHKQTNGWALSEQLTDALSVIQTVYFIPSHNCSNDWSTWMYPTNTKLVWSWVRGMTDAYETNALNEGQRWNPILPINWVNERISP